MWSPQTPENQKNTTKTTSDSKKNEKELDADCKCSSSDAAAAVVDAGSGSSGDSSQQQQSNNSRKIGGKPTAFHASAKEDKEEFDSGAIDSGFISGPQQQQQSELIDAEAESEEEEVAVGGKDPGKYNIPSQQQQQSPQQKKEEQQTILDSGCIDEADFSDEHDDDDDYQQHEAAAVAEVQQPTLLKPNETQSKQVQHERSNAAVAAAPITTTTTTETAEPMILKANVDAGMSEWFCNLSLQTEPRLAQQQSSVSAAASVSASAIDMNNLGRKSSSCGSSNNSRQQQQAAAGISATTTTATPTTTTNVTPTTAWEKYYQQNDDGDTPLHLACIHGFVDVVAALIRMAPHPCLFNIQNDDAQTPLHLAALTAQPKILRMLLIAGAEPTIRDRHGNTALHLACSSGEEQCVRALIMTISASEIHEAHRQYGHRSNDKTVSYLSYARLPSDLEIPNYDGERCVHLAAQAGHIEILRILVTHEADINAREGKSGRTPLHIAIDRCNEDLANFLLDECEKVDLETATYAGLTAYQVACIQNKLQMQNILEKRGAEPLTPPDSDYDYDSSDIEADLDDSKYDRFGDPGYFVSYNGGNFMAVV